MIRKAVLGVIFALLFCGALYAEVSLKAEVNKTELTTDDLLAYKLTVSSEEKNIPRPVLPEFGAFNVVSSAESSSLSFSQGKIKSVSQYLIVLAPKEKGRFKIGSAAVKIGGKEYVSEKFEIEVDQGKKQNIRPENPALPAKPLPQSDQPQLTL